VYVLAVLRHKLGKLISVNRLLVINRTPIAPPPTIRHTPAKPQWHISTHTRLCSFTSAACLISLLDPRLRRHGGGLSSQCCGIGRASGVQVASWATTSSQPVSGVLVLPVSPSPLTACAVVGENTKHTARTKWMGRKTAIDNIKPASIDLPCFSVKTCLL
jgi:hypothetical protein